MKNSINQKTWVIHTLIITGFSLVILLIFFSGMFVWVWAQWQAYNGGESYESFKQHLVLLEFNGVLLSGVGLWCVAMFLFWIQSFGARLLSMRRSMLISSAEQDCWVRYSITFSMFVTIMFLVYIAIVYLDFRDGWEIYREYKLHTETLSEYLKMRGFLKSVITRTVTTTILMAAYWLISYISMLLTNRILKKTT